MKTNNIPPYILCPTPDLARQVLEKIERESDLRWYSNQRPTENQDVFRADYYPEMVIQMADTMHFCSKKHFEKIEGITNFTKAEDYLLSDETKIRLEELDNQLDKLINDMTNKTWETLSEGDYLLHVSGHERKVLEVIGHLVALKTVCEDGSDVEWFSKGFLIDLGYKIKGASEEKPGLDDVIKMLKGIDVWKITSKECGEALNRAIEMLKKLK